MLLTTQGLVLHTTKYSETSIIAKVFTRELGLCSYIVKGVRSKTGRTKQNLLQPLSHLAMTVYNNPRKQLQYIKELHLATAEGVSDGVGMAMRFFMDEVLYKSLKDNEPNKPLFDYVVDELRNVSSGAHTPSMPISFLIGTARHLGIEPLDNYSANEPLFNLKEGRFLAAPSLFSAATDANIDYFLDASESANIHSFLASTLAHSPAPALSAKQRSATLNNLLEYYHIHFSDFRNFKSHEVLHSVLR